MEFYLPNFEDMVDPKYDFINDRRSPKRKDRLSHDWYAHQFFDEPIFDGMLISKTVISSRVEGRIKKLGSVHKFVRLNPEIPIMGDCGAFSYHKEETPPYTVDEILTYYETLGFTYGVSIDHLIFSSFPAEERERRWKLTLQNAEAFLRKHGEKRCTFTPVGIAQGDSPEQYALAIRRLVEMGYEYLALGGLARSNDKNIRRVLQAVSPELSKGVKLHLFGVARLALIPDFLRYGVTSVDSASPIRRAFLGNGQDNYWAADGKRYAAIRVPDARSKRRKRGVAHPEDILQNNGRVVKDQATLEYLEDQALTHLRDYDRGKRSLQHTLEAVLKYDRLFGKERDHEAWYRRVLQTQPWKECPCPICRAIGIEVIIFRGNDRNRRRGFHNAKVFYDHFRQTVDAVLQQLKQPLESTAQLESGLFEDNV